MTVKLSENLGTLEATPPIGDGIYEVTILREAKGSSGTYLASAIESVPSVFTPNTISFFSHITGDDNALANRNVRKDAAGKILESWVEDSPTGKVAKGKYQVLPEHREFVEFFKDSIALSINAMAKSVSKGADGGVLVESLDADDPLKSLDVVWVGGIAGAGFDRHLESLDATKRQRIFESATTFGVDLNKPTVALAEDNKKGSKNMEEKLDKLIALFEAFTAQKAEETVAEASAEAIQSAVTLAVESAISAAKTVEEADILPSQKESLLESVKRGEDVTTKLSEAVKIAVEAKATFATGAAQETGRIGESAKVTVSDAQSVSKLSIFGGSK